MNTFYKSLYIGADLDSKPRYADNELTNILLLDWFITICF